MYSLTIHDCPADTMFDICILTTDHTERHVTLLLDSSDDWSPITYRDDLLDVFGFLGRAILKDIIDVPEIIAFRIQRFEFVGGQPTDTLKTKPFYRDGSRFRLANVDKRGNVTFLPEDEI